MSRPEPAVIRIVALTPAGAVLGRCLAGQAVRGCFVAAG